MENLCHKIAVIGGDLRSYYMSKSLLDSGYKIGTYSLIKDINHENCQNYDSFEDLANIHSILICPTPMSKDTKNLYMESPNEDLSFSKIVEAISASHLLIAGSIPSAFKEVASSKNINTIDLMDNDVITINNAIATAEGTIFQAIKSSTINIHNSHSLVLGYGRCAKVLANKLRGLDSQVTIAARSRNALAYAFTDGFNTVALEHVDKVIGNFNFIFNSIPAQILNKPLLDKTDLDTTIIDIASFPGGIDYKYANSLGLNAQLCPGLPGIVSPETSARILLDEILPIINNR